MLLNATLGSGPPMLVNTSNAYGRMNVRKRILAWSTGISVAATLVAGPAFAASWDYNGTTVNGTKSFANRSFPTSSKTFVAGYMNTGCGSFSGRLRKDNNLSPDTTISSFSGSGCGIEPSGDDASVSSANNYHPDFTYGSAGKSFGEAVVQH